MATLFVIEHRDYVRFANAPVATDLPSTGDPSASAEPDEGLLRDLEQARGLLGREHLIPVEAVAGAHRFRAPLRGSTDRGAKEIRVTSIHRSERAASCTKTAGTMGKAVRRENEEVAK
jgi:hypothetical protein